jgi:hypothetical protein
MGFQAGGDLKTGYERMKAKVNDELKQHFRPEFLNRVDDTIVFPQLSQDEIIQIVDLMIAKVDERLRDRDMGIELTPPTKVLLATKGYDPVLGARPLRPHDPARHRGPALREDPLRRAACGPDRGRGRRGHGRERPVRVPRRLEGRRRAGDASGRGPPPPEGAGEDTASA